MENEKKLKFNPDDMIAAADEQFLAWMKNGRYAELIDTMPNLGRYSLRNQMLILMQNPKATCVNGMNAWNYKRRHIEKGQTSIRIIAPKFASQVSTDKDGNITEKTLDTVTGYEVNFVYDVSQTAGEPVKDLFADSTAVDRYDTVAAAIKGAAKGFEFKTHEKTEDESHGILDTLNKTISVRADLSKEDALRVLVQQVAAANVLMRDRRHFQGISPADMANINTVEASAIAHTVCKRLKLNAPALTAPDFEGMSDSNISRFAENVGVIRSVSQRMINSAEGAVVKELYEEAQAAAEKEKAQPEITDAKPKEKKDGQAAEANAENEKRGGNGMIGGEIVPILEAIEFSSKDELLTKLRDMREATVRLAPADRRVVKQMLGIAIQEVCYTSERELLRYKGYTDYKKGKRKKEAA